MPVGDAFPQSVRPPGRGDLSRDLADGGRAAPGRAGRAAASTALAALAMAVALAAGNATLSARMAEEREIYERAAATPTLTVVSLSAPGDAGDTEGHVTLETEDGFVFATTDVDPGTWAGLRVGQEARNSRYGVPYAPDAGTILPSAILALGVFGAALSGGMLLLLRRRRT